MLDVKKIRKRSNNFAVIPIVAMSLVVASCNGNDDILTVNDTQLLSLVSAAGLRN